VGPFARQWWSTLPPHERIADSHIPPSPYPGGGSDSATNVSAERSLLHAADAGGSGVAMQSIVVASAPPAHAAAPVAQAAQAPLPPSSPRARREAFVSANEGDAVTRTDSKSGGSRYDPAFLPLRAPVRPA
jgi:hypothetical protein